MLGQTIVTHKGRVLRQGNGEHGLKVVDAWSELPLLEIGGNKNNLTVRPQPGVKLLPSAIILGAFEVHVDCNPDFPVAKEVAADKAGAATTTLDTQISRIRARIQDLYAQESLDLLGRALSVLWEGDDCEANLEWCFRTARLLRDQGEQHNYIECVLDSP